MAEGRLLEIDGLEVYYDGAMALDGVTLHVDEGEMVCVIGANGAGKTTTIRTVAGMVRPRAGRVRWRGHDVTGLPAWDMAELGIVQVAEGRQIFPNLSVAENLHLGGALKRARRDRRRNIDQVYHLFPRLRERERQNAGTLSGGEQQMLAIGRGLMANPEFVMLDEPSVGLSPALTHTMFDIVRLLHGRGVTIMLVEQNVAEALQLCDRGYVLENGRMTIEGSSPELMGNDAVRSAYLGL